MTHTRPTRPPLTAAREQAQISRVARQMTRELHTMEADRDRLALVISSAKTAIENELRSEHFGRPLERPLAWTITAA